MAVPQQERAVALMMRESADGYGYALYKVAPEGWPVGYLVLTKKGKSKKRGIKFVKDEPEARKMVERFKFV